MNSAKLFFLLFLSVNFCSLSAQDDSALPSSTIRIWQKKHEQTLIKYHVNNDTIRKADDEFELNIALLQLDSLFPEDIKDDYMVFYKNALIDKIDSIDSMIANSRRLVYDAGLYSNLVYAGLSISGKTGFHPALDHSLSFIGKNGFYLDAGVSFWKRLDTVNLKYIGLGYSKSKNVFSYDISYQRLILQYGTLRVKNELKHCFDFNSNVNLNWFNIGVDATYLFGLNQLFTANANAEFCIRGTSLFHPLSSWKLGFDMIAYAATDEVLLRRPKVIKNLTSKKLNEKLTDHFALAAFEFQLPFTYSIRKFSSILAANYAFPQTNTSGNRFIKRGDLPVKSPNQFYFTLSLSYSFLLNKKQVPKKGE
jgi:hypothetical protein